MPVRFSGSPCDIVFTNHALARMQERGFTVADVFAIINLGRARVLRDGKLLRCIACDSVAASSPSSSLRQLLDCSVILTVEGVVVTVYHNDERCPIYWTQVLS